MKKKIYYVCAAIIGVFSFLYPQNLFGETIILTNEISDNEHWVKQGNPYILKNNIVIQDGQTLTIDPGVIVKSDNSYISVFGKLIASGTPFEKITFTSYSDDSLENDSDRNGINPHEKGVFDARGIFFNHTSAGSVLNNVEMKYNSDGIAFSSSSAILSNIFLSDNSRGLSFDESIASLYNLNTFNTSFALNLVNKSAVTISSSTFDTPLNSNSLTINESSIIISNSVLKNNSIYEPIQLINSTATIQNSSFLKGNQNGIDSVDSNVNIFNTTISEFIGSGIRLQEGKTLVSSSSVKKNGTGILYQYKKNIGLSKEKSSLIQKTMLGVRSFIGGLFSRSVYAESSPVEIKDSTIEQNTFFGIQNDSTTTIYAEKNYWGDDSGPFNIEKNQTGKGNSVTGRVNFTPWIKKSRLPLCCSSILFLPGIEGSRLYKKGFLTEDQLWEPNRKADVEDLMLDENGKSIKKDIYTRDIITSTNVLPFYKNNIYKSFSERLNSFVNIGAISSWKSLPYDWRLNNDDIINNGINLQNSIVDIETELTNLASSSKTGKVTIIAHSNGGLLAKSLLKKLQIDGKENSVDKLILVASPQVGTPQAIPALLHGDDQALFKGLLLSKDQAQRFGEHMISSYSLLPSQNFFPSQTPIITFNSSIDTISNLRKIYGNTINDYEHMENFLSGKDGRRKQNSVDTTDPNVLVKNLLIQANTTHNNIDTITPTSSIQLFQISGVGRSTTFGTEYFKNESCADSILFCSSLSKIDHRNNKSNDGDGTVLSKSATISSGTNLYIDLRTVNTDLGKNFAHADILEIPFALNMIQNIILNNPPQFNEYILRTNHKNYETRTTLSVHSPVSINVYDSSGNHTGLINNQNSDLVHIEENIPNSSYSEEGEGKYVYLDSNLVGMTTVNLQGTGMGTFTFDKEISINGSTSISKYENIPVTDQTKASFVFSSQTKNEALLLDEDGDNKIDLSIKKDQPLTPFEYLVLLRKMIISCNFSDPIQKVLQHRLDVVEKLLKKEKYSEVQQIIKIFLVQLSSKNWQSKKLLTNDKLAILSMLYTFIDNLEKKI